MVKHDTDIGAACNVKDKLKVNHHMEYLNVPYYYDYSYYYYDHHHSHHLFLKEHNHLIWNFIFDIHNIIEIKTHLKQQDSALIRPTVLHILMLR